MNKNTPFEKMKAHFKVRWHAEDYPGGNPRFQISLLGKDFVIFCLLPFFTVLLFKSCETAFSADKKPIQRQKPNQTNQDPGSIKSQIIDFQNPKPVFGYVAAKRAPGTLVRVRLMNVLDTFGSAPVHAQIVDAGLGKDLIGGTVLGDATPDTNLNRINIDFKLVRHPRRDDLAIPISARALSLDGTFGVIGTKKEGFFARAAIRSSGPPGDSDNDTSGDLKQMIAKAFAKGLMQEFTADSQVANNRAQVLTLQPLTEFYVELTDYFPGQKR
jgi:hypothetical protein